MVEDYNEQTNTTAVDMFEAPPFDPSKSVFYLPPTKRYPAKLTILPTEETEVAPDQSYFLGLINLLLETVSPLMGGGARSDKFCMGCERIPHTMPQRPCTCVCHEIRECLKTYKRLGCY